MEEGVVVGQPPNDFDGSPFTESRRAKKMCDVCCDVPPSFGRTNVKEDSDNRD